MNQNVPNKKTAYIADSWGKQTPVQGKRTMDASIPGGPVPDFFFSFPYLTKAASGTW
jgi:hypothetical protein